MKLGSSTDVVVNVTLCVPLKDELDADIVNI
jgi:hypothetical protein